VRLVTFAAPDGDRPGVLVASAAGDRVLELSAPRALYLNPAWLPSTLRQMR
jgi:hypothetical protein